MRTLFVSLVVASASLAQNFDSALVKQVRDLDGRGRAVAAVEILRKAIAAAPDSLAAHREYVRTRAFFVGDLDAVRREYEALAAESPSNPVYPLALMAGLEYNVGNEMDVWRRVAQLAPDWSWGHYARGWVAFGRNYLMTKEKPDEKGDAAIAEFLRASKIDPTVPEFYDRAIQFQRAFGRVDPALAIAERMVARPETHAAGLPILWRLRLEKANDGKADDGVVAQDSLRAELVQLSKTTNLELLGAVYRGYRDILNDQSRADALQRRINELDAGWFPERGSAEFRVFANTSGLPIPVLAVNEQCGMLETIRRIALRRDADWRIAAADYRKLLGLNLSQPLERALRTMIFGLASRNGDMETMQKEADRLVALDSADVVPLAILARGLADREQDLPRALALARRAQTALSEFHLFVQPANLPEGFVPLPSAQQQNWRRKRAVALDASGWVLWKMGDPEKAVATLRQSLGLDRVGGTLDHLAQVLDHVGQSEEAAKLRSDLEQATADTITHKLVHRPAPDFEFEGLDGKHHKLSDYRDKIVLVTFWATWCAPCVGEMPLFAQAYEKYHAQGLEILALSGDSPEDRGKVVRFIEEHHIPFPAGFDSGAASAYSVDGYPTNLVIDRQGTLRYRDSGAFTAGELEQLLRQLTGAQTPPGKVR